LTEGAETEFDIELPMNQTHYYIQSLGYETVTVPAGTFEDCLKLKTVITTPQGDTTQISTFLYGEGVGEVVNDSWNPWYGDMRLELTEYRVGPSGITAPLHAPGRPSPQVRIVSSGGSTEISYMMSTSGRAQLIVCNPRAQIVQVLADGQKTRGLHSVPWNRISGPHAGGLHLLVLFVEGVRVAAVPSAIFR
jgi:hypothetical protein